MKIFYRDSLVTLYLGDARDMSPKKGSVLVTDPPFNIGYSYKEYADKLSKEDYDALLDVVFKKWSDKVIIHYAEDVFRWAIRNREIPTKCVSWVYNSHLQRAWRMLAYFGVTPDFKKVGQPYKNPTDKRVKKLIAAGKQARLYDWWEIQQVKNVNKEKTAHPCQMPLDVMLRALGVLPSSAIIMDPFAGSGSTLVAAKMLGMKAFGVEKSETYCAIIAERLRNTKRRAP